MKKDPVTKKGSRELAVPSGRLARFLQLGATAGQMAAAGAREKVRRFAQREEVGLAHVLLSVENAHLLAARLSRLRGAAMKVGQMLSLEGDSLLPREFAEALAVLRSSAHHMPQRQLEGVLRAEYGSDYAKRFAQLEMQPLAAASIGQVHRATTHDGLNIVLKIQYPGVAESIEGDVDNLRSLIALTRLVPAAVDIDALTEAVKAELRREVDYEQEIGHLEAYRLALGDDPRFNMPRGIAEHSTRRILAMDHVKGVPLLTWASAAPQADRDRVARLLLELLMRELFEMGLSQTDPNPGNFFYDQESGRLVLLDFGATRRVPPQVRDAYRNATLAMFVGDKNIMEQALRQMDVMPDGDSEAGQLLVEVALMTREVFDDLDYDYGTTDLHHRIRDRAAELIKYRSQLRPPSPEYIFFQRKLSGVFLLCRTLRARVNLRSILRDSGHFALD